MVFLQAPLLSTQSQSNETKGENMVITEYALTTIDNPFDPFTDFDKWFVFDVTHNYNSCALLGRIARTSEQLSQEENNDEISRSIDTIIKYDLQNIYIKVSRQIEID